MIFKTSEMKTEDRVKQVGQSIERFDTCEYCGTFHDGSELLNSSRYFHKYRMILCDRCVDNFDVFNRETNGSYWPISSTKIRKIKPFIEDSSRIPKIVSFD